YQIACRLDFGDVTCSAQSQGFHHHISRALLGEKDDLASWNNRANAPGSLDLTETGKTNIHEHHVRLELQAFVNGFQSIHCFAHQPEIRMGFQHRTDVPPELLVILYKQDPGNRNSSVITHRAFSTTSPELSYLNHHRLGPQKLDLLFGSLSAYKCGWNSL